MGEALAELSPALLHPAGETRLDNRLESEFYHLPETKFIPVSWPQVSLFHLRNVSVVGDQGNVFLEDGRLLSVCPSTQEMADSKIRRPIPLGAQRIREPVFHLTGCDHSSHGHFILNHLPRLMIARDLLMKDSRIRVLCAPHHRKWQMRYLRELDIDPERVIECSHGTIHTDELYYAPMLNGSNNHPDPAVYLDIRDRIMRKILPEFPTPISEQGKPIFISRLDAPGKRISNEDALVDATREVLGDVERVLIGELSWRFAGLNG